MLKPGFIFQVRLVASLACFLIYDSNSEMLLGEIKWDHEYEILGIGSSQKKKKSLQSVEFISCLQGGKILHTLPSKKHLKIQQRLQISSSVFLRIFCSYGGKRNEEFVSVKNTVKGEEKSVHHIVLHPNQPNLIAPHFKCSEFLGIGIIRHFRLVIFSEIKHIV